MMGICSRNPGSEYGASVVAQLVGPWHHATAIE
jgi:hypothetical protein